MRNKTLVLGASVNTEKYSNAAIRNLLKKNIEVVAFGIREGWVGDVMISPEMKPYPDIHTVSLYISPKHQKAYFDYIVSLCPERVIFNPGTENPELFEYLKENGIDFEIACTLTLLATNQY